MADIELVIKVPQKVYNALNHAEFDANFVVNEMRKSITNGVLLPKGHGDLKDTNNLKSAFILESKALRGCFTDADIATVIYNSPTIIEADEETRCMSNNIFEKMTEEEWALAWMFAIFNKDEIIAKTDQWTKEAEEAGMTFAEYLKSISPLNNKKSSWLGKNCKDCGNKKCKELGALPKGYDCALWQAKSENK